MWTVLSVAFLCVSTALMGLAAYNLGKARGKLIGLRMHEEIYKQATQEFVEQVRKWVKEYLEIHS